MHVVLTKSRIQYGFGEFKPSIFMEGSLMQTPNCWSSTTKCKQTENFLGDSPLERLSYVYTWHFGGNVPVLDWRINASYVWEVKKKTQIKIAKKCRWSGCPNWHKICCRQMFMESFLCMKAIFSCDSTSPLCCINPHESSLQMTLKFFAIDISP